MRLRLSDQAFVTLERTAVMIWSSQRAMVAASVVSSVTCSFCAHQS
jgi:hypothetical protein